MCKISMKTALAAGLFLAAAAAAAGTAAASATGAAAGSATVTQLLEGLPLLFVPEEVDGIGPGFAVRGSQTSLWLTERGLTYRLHPKTEAEGDGAQSWAVALDLVGAEPRTPVGQEPLQTRVSYFKGPKTAWRTGLPTYGSVIYREPWPGVDLVMSGRGGELESTFVVRPGADPSAIRLAYRGASTVRLAVDGSVVVETPLGDITERAPVAYQELDGRRVAVPAAFELDKDAPPGRQSFRFRLGEHDPARELVIDPVTLVYCGYIGGAGIDDGNGIAVDAAGSAYVTGSTFSTQASFPVTVGPDLSFNGGNYDAFVVKVRPNGSALEYCGYIGGSGWDEGKSVAVDSAGSAYVTGFTDSSEATFPVVVGPDLTYNGDWDGFVARVNAAGTGLDYCGYVGGAAYEYGNGIAVEGAGNAYVTGETGSTEATFPVTVGPDLSYNGSARDAFIAKVRPDGTGLDYCGYIGGSDGERGFGIAVDAIGNAYVTGVTASNQTTFPVTVGPDLTHNGGADAFVAKIRADGTGLAYCGYVGGVGWDDSYGIAADPAENAYITGNTFSSEETFPVTVGPDLESDGVDAFVAKIRADGTGLDYCGYIGGRGWEVGAGIAIDGAGNAFVAGWTLSDEATFPVTVGPDLTYKGMGDVFVARISAAGTNFDYCGYIGSWTSDKSTAIAVDAEGNAYVCGVGGSPGFPVTVGPDLTWNGGRKDAFVAKVSSFDLIFADDFESGTTSAWSFTQP